MEKECAVPGKFHTHPWKVIGNPSREGVLEAKILEGKYEAKLEFPRGRGCKTKTFCGGWVWIFSGTAQSSFLPSVFVFN